MKEKLKRIASVLVNLSTQDRADLVNELLPTTHTVVPIYCEADIEAAFRTTAARLHLGLKAVLKFDPRVIRPCWAAMVKATAASRKQHAAPACEHPSTADDTA
jgi:hypothetical protein